MPRQKTFEVFRLECAETVCVEQFLLPISYEQVDEGFKDFIRSAWASLKKYYDASMTSVVYKAVRKAKPGELKKVFNGYLELIAAVEKRKVSPAALVMPITDLAAVMVITPAIQTFLTYFTGAVIVTQLGTLLAILTKLGFLEIKFWGPKASATASTSAGGTEMLTKATPAQLETIQRRFHIEHPLLTEDQNEWMNHLSDRQSVLMNEGFLDIINTIRSKIGAYYNKSVVVKMYKALSHMSIQELKKIFKGYKELLQEIKKQGFKLEMLSAPITDLASIVALSPAIIALSQFSTTIGIVATVGDVTYVMYDFFFTDMDDE